MHKCFNGVLYRHINTTLCEVKSDRKTIRPLSEQNAFRLNENTGCSNRVYEMQHHINTSSERTYSSARLNLDSRWDEKLPFVYKHGDDT